MKTKDVSTSKSILIRIDHSAHSAAHLVPQLLMHASLRRTDSKLRIFYIQSNKPGDCITVFGDVSSQSDIKQYSLQSEVMASVITDWVFLLNLFNNLVTTNKRQKVSHRNDQADLKKNHSCVSCLRHIYIVCKVWYIVLTFPLKFDNLFQNKRWCALWAWEQIWAFSLASS